MTATDLTAYEAEIVQRAVATESARHYEVFGKHMTAAELGNSRGRAIEAVAQQRHARAAAELATAQRREQAAEVAAGFARVVRALHRLAERLRADAEIARVFGEHIYVADKGPDAAALADLMRTGGAPSWYADGAPDPLTVGHPVTLTLIPLDVPAPGETSAKAFWEFRLPDPRMVGRLLDVRGCSRFGAKPAESDGPLTLALARCGLSAFVPGAPVDNRIVRSTVSDNWGNTSVTYGGYVLVRDSGSVPVG